MSSSGTLYYLSIDIESTGDRFNNPVIAIGACFGPADGSWSREKLKIFRGNLKPLPGDTNSAECMAEFWAKFPLVYQEILDGAKDASVVMTEFLHFCQDLVRVYEEDPLNPGRIKIISDCPDFDLGRLHYLGEIGTKTWPSPIRNLGTANRRHGQVDPCERVDALDKWDECDAWIAKHHPGVVHDHRPEHDAEHSYCQMLFLHSLSVGEKK